MVPRQSPGISPKSKALSRSAVAKIADRRIAEILTDCGCIFIPLSVIGITKEAHCPAHGWQKISRKATLRDLVKYYHDIDIPKLEFPDEPAF